MPAARSERRPRGRPPRPDLTSRRRQELVVAAYEVFAERGYTDAGVADIVAHLGIGHGTFYRYFASKREILDSVIDYGVERILTEIQAEVSPDSATSLEQLLDQVEQIVDRLFALLDAEPGLVQLILFEATSIDEELTHRVLGLADTFGAVTASYLNNGIRHGFIRDDIDVPVVAEGITALVLPGLLQARRGSFGPRRRKRYMAALLDLATAGLAPR
jgi:AcrR family transcriptional regulator